MQEKTKENEWIDVPKDWDKPFCPHLDAWSQPAGLVHLRNPKIEVHFRNSEIMVWRLNMPKFEWVQEGSNWDIVKYRLF